MPIFLIARYVGKFSVKAGKDKRPPKITLSGLVVACVLNETGGGSYFHFTHRAEYSLWSSRLRSEEEVGESACEHRERLSDVRRGALAVEPNAVKPVIFDGPNRLNAANG
jgi:hypothetical protein